MELGFFTMPMHPLDKDWRVCLREDKEAFVLADQLGYTEAYIGEHVTDKAESVTSCVAFLAWVAAETKNIRLGTGTVNMPNTHPAACRIADRYVWTTCLMAALISAFHQVVLLAMLKYSAISTPTAT